MKKPGSGRAFHAAIARASLQGQGALHQRGVAREGAEEHVLLAFLQLETSKVTESFSPEPISLVWAMTRLSSGFR